MGEINGLLELLWDMKGRVNVFELNDLIAKDFTKTMRVVKSAELLDFVDTPRQQVELTPRGTEYVSAGVDARTGLLKASLLQLEIFKHLVNMLERAEEKSVPKDVVLEMLAIKLPYEHPERLFQTVLNWGRTAKLLAYESGSNLLSLHPTMGGPRKTRPRKEKPKPPPADAAPEEESLSEPKEEDRPDAG
jgi:NitT/TauT family transport system ATP-binding protein